MYQKVIKVEKILKESKANDTISNERKFEGVGDKNFKIGLSNTKKEGIRNSTDKEQHQFYDHFDLRNECYRRDKHYFAKAVKTTT